MKGYLVVLFSLIIISLSAQFNNPIHINEDLEEVFFRGNDAYEIIGDTVFLTFVEAETGNVYLSYSSEGNAFTNYLVEYGTLDKFTKLRRMLQPTIEVTPGGRIIIFYVIENERSTILKKAISDDQGQTFSTVQIAECVSSFSSQKDESKVLLSYCEGTSVPFTDFQYFTNSEKSENEDGGFSSAILKFWGVDEFFGPVHSNDDIWIADYGGSFPNFEKMVTTSGRILYDTGAGAPSYPPVIWSFPNGYIENCQKIDYEPSLNEIAVNGINIGQNADIVYMKIDGSIIQTMFGEIHTAGTQRINVYSWFPHNTEIADSMALAGYNWFEDSDIIGVNEITIYDTIWTVGNTLQVDEQTYWIGEGAELWIEGEIEGMLTIGCAENIRIVGDITYANTAPGSPPDDPDDPNMTDYFGLVSGKRIYLSYKHKDPFNNMELRDDNCSDVMLYGAYAAMGIGDTLVYGDMACHYDGIFSFEYQHPHGSTPDFTALSPYTLQETLYTYVDLHKYIFPQSNLLPPEIEGFNLHGGQPIDNLSCGYPYESNNYVNSYPNNSYNDYVYPYGTDYPWYNPVWPESVDDIFFERGILTIFGPLIQTRRGFIHRSGSDPYNHPGDNEWDLDEFHYDGVHSSAGYNKEYHPDMRFIDTHLQNFPRTNLSSEIPHIIVSLSEDEGSTFINILDEVVAEQIVQFLDIDIEDDMIMLIMKVREGLIINTSFDNGQNFSSFLANDITTQKQFVESINIFSGVGYINTKLYNEEVVFEFDPIAQSINIFYEENDNGYLSTFAVGNSGCKIYIKYNEVLDISYTGDDISSLSENVLWQPPINFNSIYSSNISANFNEQDSVYVCILNAIGGELFYTEGDLFLYSGSLGNLVDAFDDQIIPPKMTLNIYPNPFNPETTITFSLATENTENAEINIYNVKGQKVRSFTSLSHPELVEGSVIWNGRDMKNKPVSTGVYLFELRSNNNTFKTKKGLLLK